ncbi:transposase family protein [Enterobacter cloacae complex sp. GF14B]|uniref:transposase family protein n=1 Tax=Enterobacter cloacae complex sp. GF14B TaxID=2511982 RepID=UPI0034D61DA1
MVCLLSRLSLFLSTSQHLPSSRSEYRYFIIFIDDFSRYTTVFLLRQKSEALSVFKQFHKAAELQIGRRLKKLRSDNGGEYVSREFVSYCAHNGIHYEHTIPYSPQ